MTKMRNARLAAAVATAIVASAVGVAGASTPAQAAPEHCQGGANEFVDIPDSMTGTLRRSLYLGQGVNVELHSAVIAGVTRGFARIAGETRSRDRVWMDWQYPNSGDGWLQCGPFQVTRSDQTLTTAAQKTYPHPRWRFRACGNLNGQPHACTAWW